MDLFHNLTNLMNQGEGVSLQIERMDDGTFRVIVTPRLDNPPEQLNEQGEKARAGLAMPLVLKGTAEELDEAFAERIQGYVEVRQQLQDRYHHALDKLKETRKEADASEAKNQGSGESGQSSNAVEGGVAKPEAGDSQAEDGGEGTGGGTDAPDAGNPDSIL